VTAPPDDINSSRRAIAADELIAEASGYLTTEVAVHLPFHSLVPFKNLLKRYFSAAPWTREDAARLSDLVTAELDEGWWEHRLSNGVLMQHGFDHDRYVLWTTGGAESAPSVFDRAFAGPVVPEATPHPRKVKFDLGGSPSPGIWYRRGEPEADADSRVVRLFAEQDVTDVMVAGDFVTVGLAPGSAWQDRLEPILAIVTEQFYMAGAAHHRPERTREELLQEAGHVVVTHRPEELHLLDPDDPDESAILRSALRNEDPRIRRIAVAILADSSDPTFSLDTTTTAYRDPSLLVRRTAVDAAADTEDPAARPLFESALTSDDPWIRWKAVHALGAIGLETSRDAVAELAEDEDFQVRLEVASVLRA
jgi:hypothetical protein